MKRTICILAVMVAASTVAATSQLTAQDPDIWDTTAPPQGGNRIAAFLSRIGANPGVGYIPPTGSYACWQSGQDAGVYLMDLDARPWGPTGNGPLDSDAFNRRYLGGGQRLGGSIPCGMAAELWRPGNESVLIAAYKGSCPLVQVEPEGRDGAPTIEEMTDLAVVARRCGEVYRTCWHERRPGGAPEMAIHASDRQMAAAGWCEPGLEEVVGPLCGWAVHYLVEPPEDAPWCEEPPEPAPDPECAPYPGSDCESRCSDKSLDRPECFELTGRFPSSLLARACAGVCRETPPEPPPPPTIRECWRWEPGATSLVRGEFVPGVQSTGRLEVELLIDGKWLKVDCPEEES